MKAGFSPNDTSKILKRQHRTFLDRKQHFRKFSKKLDTNNSPFFDIKNDCGQFSSHPETTRELTERQKRDQLAMKFLNKKGQMRLYLSLIHI